MAAEPAGYASARYAQALALAGRPRALGASWGWLLERPVEGSDRRDAMGLYPLFACEDWAALPGDLAACTDLVSVVAVPDPHGDHEEALLREAFPDLLAPFKRHYVCTLGGGPPGSRHHRYYARRALRRVEVEEAAEPSRHLDEWTALYTRLVERHGLTGLHAFSRESFAGQLAVPGAVLLRAVEGGAAVAAQLWYVRRGVAYSHLTAASARGYELRATYALHAAAAQLLRGRAEVLHLGGAAGRGDRAGDGLAAFKSGWATGTTTAHLAGRVLDRERYDALAQRRGARGGSAHFPAYRAGELA